MDKVTKRFSQITAVENVPIASWLVLGGKCSSCGTPISSRYPFVEALGGILAAAAIWRFGAPPGSN